MTQGPSGSRADKSWCTDLNLDWLHEGGPDQVLKIDVVSEEDAITTFTLFPHWYDLASEGNHFRSLQFKIIPGHGKVTLQSRFSGDIKELPLVTELECGTVCEDTEHPNGQRVPISWDRQITRRGSDYQCRDKPAHTTPCPSDNEAERTEGLREGSDLEQPIENSFSRATA